MKAMQTLGEAMIPDLIRHVKKRAGTSESRRTAVMRIVQLQYNVSSNVEVLRKEMHATDATKQL